MCNLGPYPLNSIITGDARELSKAIPDESVDLIYCDYVYDDFDFGWVDQCARILKSTGSIYVQTDYRSVAEIKLYLDCHLTFINWIVWCYKANPSRGKYYQRKHDDILFYVKSDNYCWNNPTQPPSKKTLKRFKTDKNGKILNLSPALKKRSENQYVRDVVCRDWWDDIPVKEGVNTKRHRWQKPEALLERIIKASSNPGDLVVDFFVGSGTTPAVCKMLNRNYLAFEINPDTAEDARQRVRDTQPPLPMVYHEQAALL